MEDKNNCLEMFDEAETHLLQLSDTVAQLREVIDNLVEENNKLRMSNNDLKSLLIKTQTDTHEEDSEGETGSQTSSGRDSLLGFYNEGIHVCHEFFGSRRSSNEQCLFCQEILERLENRS